jgi:hypothetical protein
MTESTLSLISGQNIRLTSHGLHIEGELTYEQWQQTLRAIQSVKSAYHCVLADHIIYGRQRFGIAQVAVALEQAELDLADVTKADAIGQLTLDFRGRHQLNSEHFFVLSKIDLPKDREKWAQIANRENLSPLELKRSIEAGKILRASQIQTTSGQGSGINTIQGVIFRMQQWEREMGGAEKIVCLPSAERQNLLKLLTPVLEIAAAIEQSLSQEEPYVG